METRDMLRMANQIAGFFKGYDHDEALAEIADHLNRFWEPRMRAALFAHLAAGAEGLDPLVVEASRKVRKPPAGQAA
jgi:formate dehydrogenase subunit delta